MTNTDTHSYSFIDYMYTSEIRTRLDSTTDGDYRRALVKALEVRETVTLDRAPAFVPVSWTL